MKQKYVKKCIALLAAGMMTVSSLSMGSLPVLAADGTENEVVTYAEEVPEEEILSDEVNEVAADIDEEPAIEEANTAAEEVAAPTEELTGKNAAVYVLMNIPYAEFYAAEGDSAVDAVSSATKNKPRTIGLSGGSYHVTREGTDITGVTYPVKVNDPSVLEGLTKITDTDSVDITVTNRGTTTTTTFTGKDVLYESPSYAYYVLDEEPASYKVLSGTNGSFSFGAATGAVNTKSGASAKSINVLANHAAVEISLDGIDALPSGTYVNGVVVTDEDGTKYGLRHISELWRGSEIGWNFDDEKLGALTEKAIKNLRFYLSDGTITDYPVDINVADAETYVLMNIPYAEFYAAEGTDAVDAVSSATKNKPRTKTLSGGSYHVSSEGTDITGVIYPVKLDIEAAKALKSMQKAGTVSAITARSSVTITVTNRGKETTTTYTGKDALYEAPSYSYFKLGEVPASYKEASYDGSAFTFGAATGQVTTVDGLTGTVKIGARHADIEIALTGVNVPTTTDADGNPVNYDVNAVVVTDADGNVYGLRHIANLWRQTEIGWNYDEAGLGNLTGGIIKNIRYYFSDGSITDYPCDIGFRVAAYNKDAAAPALIKSAEQTDEQYATYLGAITKVTVDGTEYDNEEPVIIVPDGMIDLAAKKDGKKVFANAKRHEVKVEAAAHDDLEFMIGGFTDVQDPSHAFFKEIYWAADLGITKGYSDGTFGIDRSCTRGEAIMFLWRLAGKPSPKWAKSKFSDVSKSNPFYKAILWAEQQGITKGFADGTFGINKSCTRGQIMTFIWRCKNKPNPKAAAKTPFKDVAKNHPYYKAILWASQNGVAKGFSDGTYGINKACTRGQMMKFFYNLEN